MNVDLNEICTNLVPFPRLQFLMTALSPQRATAGSNTVHDGAFISGSGSSSGSAAHTSGSSGAASGSKNSMQVCSEPLITPLSLCYVRFGMTWYLHSSNHTSF